MQARCRRCRTQSRSRGTLTTQGSAIVSLENSLNALDVGGANQIPDSGSLVRYGNVSTDKYNGNGVMAFTLKAGQHTVTLSVSTCPRRWTEPSTF
jgi:hypothetical protein